MPRVLNFARLGEPILYEKTPAIADPTAPQIQEAIADMLHTMEVKGPCFGLAAPQVFLPLRITIFSIPKVPHHNRYSYTPEYDPDGVPQTIMINPEITVLDQKTTPGWEGCLSVPGLLGEVERYHSIRYTFQSLDGQTHTREAHGFHARVVQHEMDHLDGILYTMRMKNLRSLTFSEENLKHRELFETHKSD